MASTVKVSDEMQAYFSRLIDENNICYKIANEARSKGYDPTTEVEIPQAEDLASRVEKLLKDYNVDGVAQTIRDYTEKFGNREIVALKVAAHVAAESKNSSEPLEKSVDRAVRVGLAVLTEGILVAPLEGIADTKIKTNSDGSNYIDLIFAGPIRAAGGTAQAMSVLIADMVRQAIGIGKYIPTPEEAARFVEEIPLYKQCQHLQFTPTSDEIALIVNNCPICVDGEGTEQVEISGFRNLPRIETNRVRGGACLVIAEGMCLKAAKLKKHVDKLGIEGWDFIGKYLDAHKSEKAKESKVKMVEPSTKYLRDMVAGRPIFGHPCQLGGFRLRYGRARTSGLAALAYNTASMYAMKEFMAIGTQVKIERPGKACVVTPCDLLEGPHILLKNGSLVYCHTKEDFMKIKDQVKEIVDNGEILVPFGEFCENNHMLVPSGYPIEWHKLELEKAGGLPDDWEDPTYERSKEMSAEMGVPLHPKFNLMWCDIDVPHLQTLRQTVLATGRFNDEGSLVITTDDGTKRTLEDLCAVHIFDKATNTATMGQVFSMAMVECLGLRYIDGKIVESIPLEGEKPLEAVSKAAGYKVMQRAGTRIGTRMGRPEKAKERASSPRLNCVFTIGKSPSPNSIEAAIKVGTSRGNESRDHRCRIEVDVSERKCPKCGIITFRTWCRTCELHTNPIPDTMYKNNVQLYIKDEYNDALKKLGERPQAVFCLDKLPSKVKVPEPLEKGILRAKHKVDVFKEGTIRYDMTDIPLTHFKPREIGLSIEKAHELGYMHDWNGDPLTDPEQIVELKVQDIIPSVDCGNYLVHVAQYIDDELDKFYGMPRYYNVNDRKDLIGHLTYALAPHTSGCILSRIIGYANVKGCFGHPFIHAGKRRNCDGDEDCVMLAMDALLNFSRLFLPKSRGGQMDAPLVLTTKLNPNEIDKEAHNVDCLREYPLELYYAAMEMKDPKEIDSIMDLVGGRIDTVNQYENFGFTHDTHDIADGPKASAYTTLETMLDKLEAQLTIGKICRSVDARDVALKVINKHFIPDMIGNLRSFATQGFRCTKCGNKYRRMPLAGACSCGHALNLTVHEASVRKYLKISQTICEEYALSDYLKERLDIIEVSMNSLFNNDKVRNCTLNDFF